MRQFLGIIFFSLIALRPEAWAEVSSAPEPTLAQRIHAARETVQANPNCAASRLGPYYWEVGDRDRALASGSVGGASAPRADTMMSIASSSKWIYSAYVLQKVGEVRSADVPFLNFTSGYNRKFLPLCMPQRTVEECLRGKDQIVSGTEGKFEYGGTHMQVHAARSMKLGALAASGLTSEVMGVLELPKKQIFYSQAQLAGGLIGSAAGYGDFLRNLLQGKYKILNALGTHKVCTNSTTCDRAISSPVPKSESWNYSLGHWVEDDPVQGDHALSSAGAFGFYPWVDASKRWYGILARKAGLGAGGRGAQPGYVSASCGRLIRKAWVTGLPVP